MNPAEILAQLRDIHMPPEPGWWPPAPGWWLLALLVAAGLTWAAWRGGQALARYLLYRRVARELTAICARHEDHGDDQRLTAELSRLLRRAALREHDREQAAGLTGDTWLAFLDRTGETRAFRDGPGRCLATAPYGGHADPVDPAALAGTVRRWLRANLGRPREASMRRVN